MRGRALRFRDFSGGLNTKAGPYGLDENEAASVLNFRPTVRGSLKSRRGDTQIHAAAALGGSTITSLAASPALGSGALDELLVAMSDGKLYHTNGVTAGLIATYSAGRVWDFADAPGAGSTLGSVLTYGTTGAVATDMIEVAAGGTSQTWSGAAPGTPKYLAYVGNRMWAARLAAGSGSADPASAVSFSELADPRTWPAANIVLLDPLDGEEITGIQPAGDGLLVAKPSKAWFIYDLDTGANRSLGVGVGCVSRRTMVTTPYGTVFCGAGTVWVTDGSTVRALSANIEPTLRALHEAGSLATATASFYEDRYLLAVGTSLYEYDFTTKSWWLHSTRGGVIATAQVSGSADVLYAGGAAGLDSMFTGAGFLTAAGGALSRSWTGPYHTLGPGKDRLRGIEVEGRGTFAIAAKADFGGSDTDLRAETALGSTVSAVRRESDFRPFAGLQVAFSSTTAADVQIDDYTLYVTRRAG